MERMLGGKRERREPLPPRAVRLVVHRPAALVLHDVALRVELLLRHRGKQLAHAIGLEPERGRELVGRHRLEVVRALEPGGAVQRAAGALHELEMLVGADVGRALKEHVLEQMGKAGATGALVRRADVIPEIHGDDGCRVVLGKRDGESVRQPKRLDRNSHAGNLHYFSNLWNPRRAHRDAAPLDTLPLGGTCSRPARAHARECGARGRTVLRLSIPQRVFTRWRA